MDIKEEKGSMAVYVTIVLLSMLFILGAVFLTSNANRNRQLKTAIKVKESYEADNDRAEEIYNNLTKFDPVPTPEPPTGGQEMADMTNEVIEIKWLSDTSNIVSTIPNAPVIKNISNGTMELVKFDSETKTWVAGKEYSYTKGTGSADNNSSKWANAKVTIGGVDSYFVWIPRYAYRIIYFDSAESKKAYQEGTLTEADAVANGKIIGYSDSRGIVDASGKKIDSIASTTKIMVSKDYFMVHPAFINDVNAGGWSSELPGIWVGKYETSGSSSQLKVQPGVSSLRNISIGDMYTYSKAYQTELKSHMLKNSEWGAVVYLTESTYGRNGTEISQNTNSSYTTGGGTGTAYYDTNKSQSTTGNEYGVYDLSGGTYEYLASYYIDEESNISNGSSFAKGTSDEYSTMYEGTYEKTAYKYGDATMETKNWHKDNAVFINSVYPFFHRGGGYIDSSDTAGGFCYGNNDRWWI